MSPTSKSLDGDVHGIRIDGPGGPDALLYAPITVPHPGDGEITIDVAYTAVGMVDVLARRGAFGLPFPITPGLSVAGFVREMGPGVTTFRRGECVAAFTTPPRFGGYADVVQVPAPLAVSLSALPGADSVSLRAGAVGIVNATTAYLAATTIAQLQPKQSVLVHGGTGALGSMLGQVSRHLGADPVLATVGHAEKIPFALELGYTQAIMREHFADEARALTRGRGLDVVFDTVGGPSRSASIGALAMLGQLIVLGNSSGAEDTTYSLNTLWLEGKGVRGLNLGALSAAEPRRFQDAARQALALVARGILKADVADTFPLANAAEAHRRLESGQTTGTFLLAASAARDDRC